MACLAQVCDSNSLFGMTDLEGFLDEPIPIQSALGDSHAALYGQGCHEARMLNYASSLSIGFILFQSLLINNF